MFFFRRAELVIHLKCKRGGETCRFAVNINFISVCEEINNLVGIQKAVEHLEVQRIFRK